MRTQSKEWSSKIRDRVAREKHRQLRNVEEIKRKELLSWKEKHVNNTMADYYYCLSNVGDAHVAAERENQLAEQIDKQQHKNRKIAVQRGRDALQKERLESIKKNTNVKRKQKISLAHKNVVNSAPADENDKLLSKDDDHQLSESDDGWTDENVNAVESSTVKSPEKHLHELVDRPKESNFRFTQVSDLIEERRRVRNLCDQILEGDFGTSQPETQSKSSVQRATQTKSSQAPPKLFHAPKSAQTKPLHVPKSPQHPTKPTLERCPVNTKGLAPKLPNAGNIAQRNVGGTTRKVVTPKKIAKSKTVVALPKFVSPQRREFVPRFNKPGILKSRPTSEATKLTTTESPEKVQFYDHFSRYGKEYDAVPGMVIRESHQPTIDANEAARVQNEMDELRFKQLEEWKYVWVGLGR